MPLLPRSAPFARLRAAAFAGLVLAAAIPASAWGQDQDQAQEAPYAVRLDGVEDAELRALLESVSTLFRLAGEPPPSAIGLERRAAADRERLQTALRSAGYYAGTVAVTLRPGEGPEGRTEVVVAVDPGPAYQFGAVAVLGPDGAPVTRIGDEPFEAAGLGLEPGARARAPDVVAAQDRLIARYAGHGYAFAKVTDRRVVVDHADRRMDVTYQVAPGPLVRLGEAAIEGLADVEADIVRGRLAWQTGEVYAPERIDRTRTAINALGVFSSVRLVLPDPDPAALEQEVVTVPVTITVTERKFRFIGAGATYSTADGLGARAYWGHRNLFGAAERLRVAVAVERIGTREVTERTDFSGSVNFRKPDFLIRDQSLLADAGAVSEKPPAYRRDAAFTTLRLERVLSEGLTFSYGIGLEQARIEQFQDTTRSTLVSAPLALSYDTTGSLLDPTHGFRLTLAATPYHPIGGAEASFLVTRLAGSAYYDVLGDQRFVAAARLTVGSLFEGNARALRDVPADKRFYTGGGGSIRGFGYQRVGPLDPAGNPIGGRALVEVGAEVRIKVTETIGIVPFLDGGNVFDTALPNLGEPLRWGAGVGLRYHTGVGPVRIDIARPLDRQRSNEGWQFYISLGQAF